MDSIPDIIKELQDGNMFVLVDDEKRENEGDLVCAAEFISPEKVNFILKKARGMMCVALDGSICDKLNLGPQLAVNTSLHSTAFTVSVDAVQKLGVHTGVSASDRAITAQTLVDKNATPYSLDRPGHVQPLRARDGGSLVRAGQTEGSVDLCRLAGLRPGAVIIEIMNDDGTMARRKQLDELCKKYKLKMCSVDDVVNFRLEREKLVQRVSSTEFKNSFGKFNLITYKSKVDSFEHIALTCGSVGEVDNFGKPVAIDKPVLVRMHSQNLLGDVFGDVKNPSSGVLEKSMRMIQAQGQGAVVYIQNKAMGLGSVNFNKSGGQNPRGYGIGSQILCDLGISKLRLITSHPFTPTALNGFGLSIEEFVSPIK